MAITPVPDPNQYPDATASIPTLDQEKTLCPVMLAAKAVLETTGFTDEATGHACAPHLQYGKCALVQGSEELRIKARQVSRLHPEALSLEVLRQVKAVNELLFLKLLFKRVAHTFELKGRISLLGEQPFLLEGWSESFSLPIVANSFRNFCLEKGLDQLLPIVDQLNSAICSDDFSLPQTEALAEDLQDPTYPHPVVISTGWDWHSTAVVIWREQAAYINRGGGTEKCKPGAHHYQIPSMKELTAEVIQTLACRHGVSREKALTEGRLVKQLGWTPLIHEGMPGQQSGNCTMATAQGVLKTLLAIHWLSNEAMVTGYPNWQTAYKAIEDLYQKWLRWDQTQVLERFITEAESEYALEEVSHSRRWAFESLVSMIREQHKVMLILPLPLQQRWSAIRAKYTPTPPTSPGGEVSYSPIPFDDYPPPQLMDPPTRRKRKRSLGGESNTAKKARPSPSSSATSDLPGQAPS